MGRETGDRAVSEVVGFVLVFGMLATAFTVYQGVVVPDQNRAVEFQHSQEVQGQLQDLRNAVVGTSATGTGRAVSITLGATYPRRALARNFGVSGGAIETRSIGNGTIRLGNTASASNAETADYLDGSNETYGTKSIVYAPVYSFYSNGPETAIDNTVLYNRFGSANVSLTDQSMIDGHRITLIAINGSLSNAQSGTVTIDTEPISVSTNRVDVVGEGGRNVRITVPTALTESQWEGILAEESVGSGGHVVDVVGTGRSEVTFVLEANEVYELRTARIGVGVRTDSTSAHYVTTLSGNGTTVVPGGTVPLTVEVRDPYHNPVSGATVNASPDGVAVPDSSLRTDSNGRATFQYTVPSDASTGQREVTFDISDAPADHEEATFVVNVLDVDGSAQDGGAAADLLWIDDADAADPPFRRGVSSSSKTAPVER